MLLLPHDLYVGNNEHKNAYLFMTINCFFIRCTEYF
uniref:Uncharacterized protein n=1 Tax=Arundo donax TaxID=35708 RepID=A0A0A9ABA4_ARUDO